VTPIIFEPKWDETPELCIVDTDVLYIEQYSDQSLCKEWSDWKESHPSNSPNLLFQQLTELDFSKEEESLPTFEKICKELNWEGVIFGGFPCFNVRKDPRGILTLQSQLRHYFPVRRFERTRQDGKFQKLEGLVGIELAKI